MTRRLRGAGIAAAVLGALALLVAGFLFGFERETRRVEVGYGPEARQNDYLAAGRLMKRLGLEVAFVADLTLLTDLPGPDGTVFIPVSRRAQTKVQSDFLLGWVAEGGSLIVTAEAPVAVATAASDYLLDAVGIGTEQHAESGAGVVSVMFHRFTPDWKKENEFSVELDTSFTLVERQVWAFWKSPLSRPKMLHLWHGQGTLTVLTGAEFMRNSRLTSADNAAFLWNLATKLDHAGPVLLVHGQASPSLISLVVSRFWPLLIGLGFSIAVVVWSSAVRLGPVIDGSDTERRSLIEHIDAGGNFLWRRGHARILLDAVRQAVMKSVSARHPSWARLSRVERGERLDAALGLTHQQRQALFGERKKWKEKPFVAAISELERIRSSV